MRLLTLLAVVVLQASISPTLQTGSLTGVIRFADGSPAAGVRVALVPENQSNSCLGIRDDRFDPH